MARLSGAMVGAALVALLVVTPACGRTETAMDGKMATAEEDVVNRGRGLAKLNPTPKGLPCRHEAASCDGKESRCAVQQ